MQVFCCIQQYALHIASVLTEKSYITRSAALTADTGESASRSGFVLSRFIAAYSASACTAALARLENIKIRKMKRFQSSISNRRTSAETLSCNVQRKCNPPAFSRWAHAKWQTGAASFLAEPNATSEQSPSDKNMKAIERATAQLTKHINDLLKKERELKTECEQVTKERTMLGIKAVEAITEDQVPVDAPFIQQVMEVLDDNGRIIKNFQRALGIFDITELNRKRKALLAAGVTREIENYNGSNSTQVLLTDEFQQALLDDKVKSETEESK